MIVTLTNVVTGETAHLDHGFNHMELKEQSIIDIINAVSGDLDDENNYKFFLNDEEVTEEHYNVFVYEKDILHIIESPAVGAIGVFIVKTLVSMAVTYAINWVANALFGDKEYDADDTTQSASYSMNNQNNQANIGAYAPVHYGTIRLYPNVLNQPLIWYDNSEEYMGRILAIGQGNYDIKSVWIGSQDVTRDKNITIKKFKADPNKTWFQLMKHPFWESDSVNMLDSVNNDKIVYPSSSARPTVHSIDSETNMLIINVVYPNGLWDITRKGEKLNYYEDHWVEIRNKRGQIQLKKRFENRTGSLDNPAREKQDETRVTYRIYRPKGAIGWDTVSVFKAQKDSKDQLVKQDCVIHSIFEMKWGVKMKYGNTECVSVIMKATGNTAGVGKVNMYVKRTDVGNTIADVCTDIYTNKQYGAGLSSGDLEFDAIAQHTKVNCSFDRKQTVMDSMQRLLAPQMFHIIPKGAKLRVKKDAPQSLPVQRYNNTRMYNVETSYLFDEYREQNDGVEVEYRDTTWKPDTVKYPKYALSPRVVQGFGIETRTGAEAYAKYMYKQEKARRQSVKFSTDIQGRVPELLDLIEITHDTVGSDGKARLFQITKVTASDDECSIEGINYDADVFK